MVYRFQGGFGCGGGSVGRHGASAQQISIFLRPIRERANLVTDLVEGVKGGGFIPLQKGKVRKIESYEGMLQELH